MRRIRCIAASALAGSLSLAPSLAAGAAGAAPGGVEVAWWTRLPPVLADVDSGAGDDADTIVIEATPLGSSAVGAVRGSGFTLELRVIGPLPTTDLELLLCDATETWTPVSAGRWEDRPRSDCEDSEVVTWPAGSDAIAVPLDGGPFDLVIELTSPIGRLRLGAAITVTPPTTEPPLATPTPPSTPTGPDLPTLPAATTAAPTFPPLSIPSGAPRPVPLDRPTTATPIAAAPVALPDPPRWLGLGLLMALSASAMWLAWRRPLRRPRSLLPALGGSPA